MGKALIVYDTVSGSTRGMAEIIRDAMRSPSVEIASVNDIAFLGAYETVLIGSPIRFGGFTAKIKKYRTEFSTKKIILCIGSLYIIHLKEEKQPVATINMQTISKRDVTQMDKKYSVGSYYPAILRQTKGLIPVAISYFNGRH